MKKKIRGRTMAILCAAVMALQLCAVSAFAAQERISFRLAEGDTVEVAVLPSAEGVERCLAELRRESTEDERMIRETVALLFEAKHQQTIRQEEAMRGFGPFWDPMGDMENGMRYFTDNVALTRGIDVQRGAYYYDTSVILTFRELRISGDRAFVSVYEWFRYKDNTVPYDELMTESGIGMDYQIDLVKRGAAWYISGVDFLDKTTEALKAGEITVEELLSRPVYDPQPAELLGGEPEEPEDTCVVSGKQAWINTARVVEYARKYAYDYNTNFPSYNEDCQNFASQCLWYGLGGINELKHINGKSWPMVVVGNRKWYQTKSYGASQNPGTSWNWSWTSCTNFGSYIKSSTGKEGLSGIIYPGIAKACVGDLIQYGKKGNEVYDHVYVVVGVTGPYGSRTAADITVCAHTGNLLNSNLLTYYNSVNKESSKTTWRTIHVMYVWQKTDPYPTV